MGRRFGRSPLPLLLLLLLLPSLLLAGESSAPASVPLTDVLDALPILAYRRLAEVSPDSATLVPAVAVLALRAPELLYDDELNRLCTTAFLPAKAAGSPGQRQAIARAREKLRGQDLRPAITDPEVRRAHLTLFAKARLHEVLARHFEAAAPYFKRLGDHQRASATCMANLRSYAAALKQYGATGGAVPKEASVDGVYDLLVGAGLLVRPSEGGRPVACPLDGCPYELVRDGDLVGLSCPTHATTEGLMRALSSPFTLDEDRRWHRENAVIWARTLWARRLNRPVCFENLKILLWSLERFRDRQGALPRGNTLDVVEALATANCYPESMLPLCPMDGQPYTVVPGAAPSAEPRLGCPNHGWLPGPGDEGP